MFSTALAAPIGNAIVERVLKVLLTRNSMILSERMDSIRYGMDNVKLEEFYGMIQVQSLLESMKEIYGWLLMLAIIYLIILMLRYSGIRPIKVIEPTYRVIYRFSRKDISIRLRFRKHNHLV